MSRRRNNRNRMRLGLSAALFTLALGLGPKSLTGQDPEPSTRDLARQRIEALLPVWEDARQRADRAEKFLQDSVRAANIAPQDTVMVGPITIVTPGGQGELARELFEEPVSHLVPILQGQEHLLDGHLWVFSYHWRWKPVYVDAEFLHDVTLSRRYSRTRVTERIRHTLGLAILRNLPEGLGFIASPVTLIPSVDWSQVYRRLATAQFLSAEECLAGDLTWCWEAFGIVPRSGGEEWSTPARRRALVSSRYERLLWSERDRLGTRENLLRGCLVMEDDRACQLILEGHHLEGFRSRYRDYTVPLDPINRGTLLSEALRLGGKGSFGRLLAAEDASVQERLAAAAGMTPDELMSEWLSRVKESRPNAQAGLLLSPLSLLLWLVILVFFATRSSRWRLG